jgi:hypothetical protein
MNQMKWMMILPLVLVLASARAQAQFPRIVIQTFPDPNDVGAPFNRQFQPSPDIPQFQSGIPQFQSGIPKFQPGIPGGNGAQFMRQFQPGIPSEFMRQFQPGIPSINGAPFNYQFPSGIPSGNGAPFNYQFPSGIPSGNGARQSSPGGGTPRSQPDTYIPLFQSGVPMPQLPPGGDIRMPQLPPDIQIPRSQPVLPLNLNQIMESPRPREFKWPTWASWQSAVGLFVLSIVIGFWYGRSD